MIKDLKVAIFEEWTDDPPAGSTKRYYIASGETAKALTWPIGEIVEHISAATGNDFDDDEDDDYYYEGEEPDEENIEEDDNDENELDGLDPTDENGDITLDDLKSWSWDNGGAGCGCIVYAEGKDIADALGEFYEEELRDSLEEPDFSVYGEEDDDETIDVDFTVMVCLDKWSGGDVEVTVPVTVRELKLLALCAIKDEEIEDCDELSDLIERIESEAVGESESIDDEMGYDEDYSDARCSVYNPIHGEDCNDFMGDCVVEYAKKHSNDSEAVELLLNMFDKLIDQYNDSIW